MTGYSVGYYGDIFKTTNGGITWTQVWNEHYFSLYGVFFTSPTNGFAVGYFSQDGRAIIQTTDGGSTWTIHPYRPDGALRDVCFTDSLNGFIVGENGQILRTTDGGTSWTKIPLMVEDLFSVHFPDSQTGYIAGEGGIILKTWDGGNSWYLTKITTQPLNSVFFINPTVGFAAGGSGAILKTTNGGGLNIEEPARKNSGIILSPNPARDRISITLTAFDPGEIKVDFYEITGRHVLSNSFRPQQPLDIDISGLTAGLYLVKVKTSNRIEVGKAIIWE
jgi:photosystem II stability/assembly factor-like uncharacterized protein